MEPVTNGAMTRVDTKKPGGSRVASHVPGRLRVRLSPTHRRPEKMAQIRDHLESQHGVHQVRARPGTGGVLVHYDPMTISVDALLDVLHEIGVVVVALTGEEEIGGELLELGTS